MALQTSETMRLGIVVERRKVDHPWQPYDWQVVAVIPGAPDGDEWRVIDEGEDYTRYHAGTLPLEIHRKDTEGYRYNLVNKPPMVYVLLREDEESEAGLSPFLATVCPFEAQAYLDGDEELLEPVPMPEVVAAWLAEYIDEHHVDEPKYKRKNDRVDPNALGFGRRRPGGGNGRGRRT
ncbi:MAG: DUF3305 domain-containing protein [Alphaproteobacteria bacterium]